MRFITIGNQVINLGSITRVQLDVMTDRTTIRHCEACDRPDTASQFERGVIVSLLDGSEVKFFGKDAEALKTAIRSVPDLLSLAVNTINDIAHS